MQTADTHYQEGLRSFESKGYSRALDNFNKAINLKPEFAPAHFQKGLCLYEFRKLDDAVASFDQAIKLNPSFSDAYLFKGRCLRDQGKTEEALSLFSTAIQHDPKNAKALLQKGSFLFDLKRTSEANQCFLELVKIDPENHTAYYNLALSHRDSGKLEESLSFLDKALKIKPDSADYHQRQGRILYELNRLDEALESFSTAAKYKLDSVASHQGRAMILREKGNLDEALVSIERAINFKPEFSYAYIYKSIILHSQGKKEEAYKAADMATKISSKDHFFQIYKVSLLYGLNRPEELQDEREKLKEVAKTLASDPTQVSLRSSFVNFQENERRAILEKFLYLDNCLFSFKEHSKEFTQEAQGEFLKALDQFENSYRAQLERILYKLSFPTNDNDIPEALKQAKSLYELAGKTETSLNAFVPSFGYEITENNSYTNALDLIRFEPRLTDYHAVAKWTLNHFVCYQKRISPTYTSDPLLVKVDFCVTFLTKGTKENNLRVDFAKKLFGDVDIHSERFTREVGRITAELTHLRAKDLDNESFQRKKAVAWVEDQMAQGINLRKDYPLQLSNATREKNDLVDFVSLLAYVIHTCEHETATDTIKAVTEALRNDGFVKFIDGVEFEDKTKQTAGNAKTEKEKPKKACCTIF